MTKYIVSCCLLLMIVFIGTSCRSTRPVGKGNDLPCPRQSVQPF